MFCKKENRSFQQRVRRAMRAVDTSLVKESYSPMNLAIALFPAPGHLQLNETQLTTAWKISKGSEACLPACFAADLMMATTVSRGVLYQTKEPWRTAALRFEDAMESALENRDDALQERARCNMAKQFSSLVPSNRNECNMLQSASACKCKINQKSRLLNNQCCLCV